MQTVIEDDVATHEIAMTPTPITINLDNGGSKQLVYNIRNLKCVYTAAVGSVAVPCFRAFHDVLDSETQKEVKQKKAFAANSFALL